MRGYSIIVALLLPLLLSAQELEVQLGVAQLQLRDQQLSPVRLSGWNGTLGLAYAKKTERRYRRFQISYTESWLQSHISDTYARRSNSTFLYFGQFSQYELWRLPLPGKLRAYAGAMGQLMVNYRQHYYIGQLDEDQFEGIVGFGATVAVEWPLSERSTLSGVMGWPVLNYVMSKGHSPRYFDRQLLAEWDNLKGPAGFLDLQAALRWVRTLGQRTHLSLSYQSRYYQHQRMEMLSHQLLLGVTLEIGTHE